MGNYIKFLVYVNLMDTKEDVKQLVKDLFTHTEYKMLAKRLEIGRLLLAGSDYTTIEKSSGYSSYHHG